MQTCKVTSYVLVICLILTGIIFLAGCTQKAPESGIVKTDAGYVSGISQDGLRVFLGIPFAAPPTGDLRWRPPAPVQPWNGVKETKEYAAACPQPPSGSTPVPMSEDCLYLNVWTPAKSADEKLPVMVFFFGGAFAQIAPAGTMAIFNGTTLAEKGVIVVTPDYRLGALGFLAHPELSNESAHNASGNYGIMDQVAALKWVQRNIGAFGGDPSRVTIFGQSAGGESVLIHLVSPESKGLYQQALVESGPFWAHGPTIDNVHSKADAEQFGVEYAQNLGISDPDAIGQMRKLSPEALINATPWPASSWERTHTLHFEPTIDGWILPDSVDALFGLHRENPVPFFIGTNANDGLTLSANANMTVPQYVTFIRNYFGKDADAVLLKYPANSTAETQTRIAQIMTNYDFADSAKFAAGSMADLNASTYLYRYSYIIPSLNMGAFHGSETLLLFGLTDAVKADPAVADNVVDLWTRFAKTGNPNGGMNVTWPLYTRAGGQYLDINITPTVIGNSGHITTDGLKTWKFVVFGDSPDPANNTTTGVSPALSPIARAIAAEKPDLALYIGDLINGFLTDASPMQNNFMGQFANWEVAVAPIHNYTTGAGIPLYVVRGNHEVGVLQSSGPLLEAYRSTVASDLPVNGPPGEEKLTYSFTHKGAKFVATDDYIAHNGLRETVNQSWVDEQLTQDARPFIFVFGHSPAYLVNNDTEDIPYSLAMHPAERDTFWKSMVNNNVSAYFCGHAHLYARGEKDGLRQIVSGNAGAPMQGFDPADSDPALRLEYPLSTITQNDQKVGYLVITVHEDSGTFNGVEKKYNPVTQSWEIGDTFTIRTR